MLFIPLLFITACGGSSGGNDNDDNDDNNNDLIDEPEALPEDDDKGTGIYKGVFGDADSGTTGNFKIEVTDEEIPAGGRMAVPAEDPMPMPTLAEYKAILDIEIEGASDTVDGTAGLYNGMYTVNFSITFAGHDFDFSLEISDTGDVADATIMMDGSEEISTELMKELSTALVEIWEGEFQGDYSGYWNFVKKDEDFAGFFDTEDGDDGTYSGTEDDNDLVFEGDAYGTGTISGYSVSGDWNSSGYSGEWSGERTR